MIKSILKHIAITVLIIVVSSSCNDTAKTDEVFNVNYYYRNLTYQDMLIEVYNTERNDSLNNRIFIPSQKTYCLVNFEEDFDENYETKRVLELYQGDSIVLRFNNNRCYTFSMDDIVNNSSKVINPFIKHDFVKMQTGDHTYDMYYVMDNEFLKNAPKCGTKKTKKVNENTTKDIEKDKDEDKNNKDKDKNNKDEDKNNKDKDKNQNILNNNSNNGDSSNNSGNHNNTHNNGAGNGKYK